MNPSDSVVAARRALIDRFFPQEIPPLWCPLITHYDSDGAIDRARMAVHLKYLSPHVKGFLIPGSTGDGWEMNDDEIRRLLEIALQLASELDVHLLIGVLKTNAAEARDTILDTLAWLRSRAVTGGDLAVLAGSHVCGFTICPPRGRELSQQQIGSALANVLETELPISLYQLPQVTENTMSPAIAAALAARFANFILFKDTSGADAVATSGQNLGGVFLVRGAEGDYCRWLKGAGGPYDGFLLSTANCFGRELHEIVSAVTAGRIEAATVLSTRLTGTVNEVFELVRTVPQGNPFANANKAMDHFFAYGPGAAKAAPPKLHAGVHLPVEVIRATGEILRHHQLMPDRGYLD